jgi:cell shape-determining protein MreC
MCVYVSRDSISWNSSVRIIDTPNEEVGKQTTKRKRSGEEREQDRREKEQGEEREQDRREKEQGEERIREGTWR